MTTVIDCSRLFQEKQDLNRVISEGRMIARDGGPDWQRRLMEWKRRSKEYLAKYNFENGPPYSWDPKPKTE